MKENKAAFAVFMLFSLSVEVLTYWSCLAALLFTLLHSLVRYCFCCVLTLTAHCLQLITMVSLISPFHRMFSGCSLLGCFYLFPSSDKRSSTSSTISLHRSSLICCVFPSFFIFICIVLKQVTQKLVWLLAVIQELCRAEIVSRL